MNSSLKWFGRIIVLGIVINATFFIPALLAPKFLLVTLGSRLQRG